MWALRSQEVGLSRAAPPELRGTPPRTPAGCLSAPPPPAALNPGCAERFPVRASVGGGGSHVCIRRGRRVTVTSNDRERLYQYTVLKVPRLSPLSLSLSPHLCLSLETSPCPVLTLFLLAMPRADKMPCEEMR